MKTLKILALGLLMVLVAVPMVGAQTWDSSFNVVNLGTTDAEVSVTFYNEAGAAYAPTILYTSGGSVTNPFMLGVGTSVEILPFLSPDADLPAGRYSVVISSDQQIAAIANLTTWIAQEGAPYFNGSYSGAEDLGETAMYMPAIVWDYYGWNSAVSIQNLSMDDATITVDFYDEQSNTVCTTYDPGAAVPGFSSLHVDVAAMDLSACDMDGDTYYNGSAVINSTMPVAAVDNQTVLVGGWYGPAGRTQTYNGFLMSQANDTLFIPGLYYLYYGWDSSFNVQNLGGTDADVTVTYSDGFVTTETIPPNGSFLFYQWAEGQAGDHAAGTYFSAVVESDAGQPLVAVVNAATNQSDGYWAPLNQSQSYSAFPGGGTNVSFPLIMMNYYDWYTSYTVQNVGANDVNLLVSYGGVPTCQNVAAGPIASGDSLEIYQGADSLCGDLAAGYRNAVTVDVVEVDGSIIGIVNQTNFTNRDNTTTTGDWSQSYNGLVSTP